MPLSERARIEVYVPDLPTRAYQDLLDVLDQELTYTFGGCTILRGLDGSYLSKLGQRIRDRINLLYTDAPIPFGKNMDALSRYTDQLRNAAFQALDEEAVLVVAYRVYHSG